MSKRCSPTPDGVGGPALRALTFHERAALLKAARQAPHGRQAGVLRPLGGDGGDPARLRRRHRRRVRDAAELRQQGHARAAERHHRSRRPGRVRGQARDVPRPAHLHVPARGCRADQRLQLPRLGHAREARSGLPRRDAVGGEAGQPDRLPHRAGVPPDHRVWHPARGLGAAAQRKRVRNPGPPGRSGHGRLHRLGRHGEEAARAPERRRCRRALQRRGGLAELLDPRARRDAGHARVRAVRGSSSSSR